MRIALVHPFCWPEVRRGGERYLDDLSWYLCSRGHDVDVVTGTFGPSTVDRTGPLTVRRLHHLLPHRLERAGVSPFDSFGAAAAPTLLSRRYDVVHCLAPSTALAARAARQRTVFTVLGHPTPEAHGGRSVRERLLRGAVRASSSVAALSSASAGAVEVLFHRGAEVLPPGTRVDRFPPNLEPRKGPVRILFASALDDRRKGLDVAVRAFGRLLGERPDARLILAGPGEPSWALAGATGAVRAAIDVLGAGELADVASRYQGATMTILPAQDEAFGLVLIESLASGTPVICADQGGMPAIVNSENVGRVVPFGDDVELGAAMAGVADLAGQPGTPSRCADHARRWDWTTSIGPAHEDLYGRVAARESAGAGGRGAEPRGER